MVDHPGLEDGKTYQVVIEKRKMSCTLQMRDVATGAYVVNHKWDLRNYSKEREVPYVTEGRIGFRQMGANQVLYRNFEVSRL